MFESFIKSVSLSCVFLFDFLDVHQDHSLGSSDNDDTSAFAFVTLESEGNFLCGFGFLSKDRLGLTTVTRLFAIVTSSTLSSLAFFTFLILSHFMDCMGAALPRAVCFSGLWDYYH